MALAGDILVDAMAQAHHLAAGAGLGSQLLDAKGQGHLTSVWPRVGGWLRQTTLCMLSSVSSPRWVWRLRVLPQLCQRLLGG